MDRSAAKWTGGELSRFTSVGGDRGCDDSSADSRALEGKGRLYRIESTREGAPASLRKPGLHRPPRERERARACTLVTPAPKCEAICSAVGIFVRRADGGGRRGEAQGETKDDDGADATLDVPAGTKSNLPPSTQSWDGLDTSTICCYSVVQRVPVSVVDDERGRAGWLRTSWLRGRRDDEPYQVLVRLIDNSRRSRCDMRHQSSFIEAQCRIDIPRPPPFTMIQDPTALSVPRIGNAGAS